jgi:hypothetical protein
LGYNLSRTLLIKTVDIVEVRRSLAFVSIPLSLNVGIPIDVISLTRASGMSRLPLDALMLGYLPLPSVYLSQDPTSGCDHYNNPDKEGFTPWTNKVMRVIKIGHHQFYRSK